MTRLYHAEQRQLCIIMQDKCENKFKAKVRNFAFGENISHMHKTPKYLGYFVLQNDF